MEKWIEIVIGVVALLFAAFLIPGMFIAGIAAFSALDCWVQKDPTNFSCYYSKGKNHRIKLEDLPK